MRWMGLLFACTLCGNAYAQEVPKAAVDALAKDLAELQNAVVDAQRKQRSHEMAYRLLGAGASEVMVTKSFTIIRAGATLKSDQLLKATKHQTFPVVDQVGDWYAVELPEPVAGIRAGWVTTTDVTPALTPFKPQVTPPATASESIFSDLAERAVKMRDAYQRNPYFTVTGFAINVGVPPSVSVNIEFKK
jgi:hypothetical protein